MSSQPRKTSGASNSAATNATNPQNNPATTATPTKTKTIAMLIDAHDRLITPDLDLEAFSRFSAVGKNTVKAMNRKTGGEKKFRIYNAGTVTPPPEAPQALISWMTENKKKHYSEPLSSLAATLNNNSAADVLGVTSCATAVAMQPMHVLKGLEDLAFAKVSKLVNQGRLTADIIILVTGYFPADHALVKRILNKMASVSLSGRKRSEAVITEAVKSAMQQNEDIGEKFDEALDKQWEKMENARIRAGEPARD